MSKQLYEVIVRPKRAAADELGLKREWQTACFASSDQLDDAIARTANVFPREDFQAKYRPINPSSPAVAPYTMPERLVGMGMALELVTELNDTRTVWERELRGWQMLCDEGAEQMEGGDAAVYLVPFAPQPGGDPGETAAQLTTYEMWHRREAAERYVLQTPDLCGVYLGLALRIDYVSDKWHPRGDAEEYTHDFLESGDPPGVWADHHDLAQATGIIICGGDMRVTAEGID